MVGTEPGIRGIYLPGRGILLVLGNMIRGSSGLSNGYISGGYMPPVGLSKGNVPGYGNIPSVRGKVRGNDGSRPGNEIVPKVRADPPVLVVGLFGLEGSLVSPPVLAGLDNPVPNLDDSSRCIAIGLSCPLGDLDLRLVKPGGCNGRSILGRRCPVISTTFKEKK